MNQKKEIKTRHHLFNYYEVKRQLEDFYKTIKRKVSEKELSERSLKLWKRMPTLEIDKETHELFHQEKDGKRSIIKEKKDREFDKLHEEIASELGIEASQVEAIRSAVLGRGETVREFGLRMFSRASLPRKRQTKREGYEKGRRSSKEWHLEIYKFMQNMTRKQMDILLKQREK